MSFVDVGGVDAKVDEKTGKFVKMRNPKEFFDFDSINFQYVGEVWESLKFPQLNSQKLASVYCKKRVGGINTDVWIGEKQMGDTKTSENK
jgi:hypothetical protein